MLSITIKKLPALALCIPSLLAAAPGDRDDTDIRTINGRSVDLAPLHQWYRNPDGERPLKHWVKLTVLEVKQPLAGAYVPCVVQFGSGKAELLFSRLPAVTRETATAIQTLQARVETLRTDVEYERALVRRDEAIHEGTIVRSAGYFFTTNGAYRYYRERPSHSAIEARLDRVALTEKEELLAKLEAQLKALRQDTQALTVFALDTRKTYGGLPIWDTGQQ